MEIVILTAIVGAVVYGLERNRVRQEQHPHPYLVGSSDSQNRDEERMSCELLGRA
jgi:hypothetical protein